MDTSYLTQQVTSIIGQLHNLFDEIGVPHHERDSRESQLFSSLSETLHNHLREVSGEKNEMVDQGKRMITTIKQMEASLDDSQINEHYPDKNSELTISYPLTECLQNLKQKHRTISRLHQERYEQVKKLVQALESYASHLESTFLQIKLPPTQADAKVPPNFDLSPSYISSVDTEFTRVYEEYNKRVTTAQQLADEIIKLWAELGTPQAQTDSNIVKHSRASPEQLGLHKDDLANLRARRDRLQDEKRGRERKVKELRTAVEGLWDRLGIEEHERNAFLASVRGCGLRAINDLEDELARLNELKRQNLHLFVEDARVTLQSLWDELYISEEEAVEFTPMFCDVFSDALLSAHEAEISKLEALKEQRAPTLELIAKYRSIIKDKEDLAFSSQDSSRLVAKKGERRDPTRLLKEEKMRKRIARELPKVEQELRKELENWEDEYGRPFLVFGERYLEVIDSMNSKAPPPRSKTPNGMQPPSRAGARTAPQPQRTGGTSKPPPPARSKTPGLDTSTMSRSVLASSTRSEAPASSRGGAAAATTANNRASPSRIPARVPLGNMPHGNNSPERRQGSPQASKGQENHGRPKTGHPTMAPPPKMRDLYAPPPASTPSNNYPEDVSRSGSIVRHITPEDPYSDTSHFQNAQPGRYERDMMPPPPRPTSSSQHHHQHQNQNNNYQQRYGSHQDPHADNMSLISGTTHSSNSRQISNTSSVAASTASSQTTAASGSENWETFEDSECEDIAYANPTQPHHTEQWASGNKRAHPHAQYSHGYPGQQLSAMQHGHGPGMNKKMRGMGMGVGAGAGLHPSTGAGGAAGAVERIVETDGERERSRTVEGGGGGSDAGWTDEDVY
ncbi:MAG: hypothetical protein M1831_004763 [Alyxoria varia]|nr:MAG: hypothetical protein M1831_004763 [Alyxoria varia]